jgi:hypothetical protein
MSENLFVPTMAEMMAQGKQPEVLFWVGCAGSFDDRAKKITKAIVKESIIVVSFRFITSQYKHYHLLSIILRYALNHQKVLQCIHYL